MSRALLDVNVLLALLDSDHVDHERAAEWLDAEVHTGWESRSVTENGFVRVISQPRYPSPGPRRRRSSCSQQPGRRRTTRSGPAT